MSTRHISTKLKDNRDSKSNTDSRESKGNTEIRENKGYTEIRKNKGYADNRENKGYTDNREDKSNTEFRKNKDNIENTATVNNDNKDMSGETFINKDFLCQIYLSLLAALLDENYITRHQYEQGLQAIKGIKHFQSETHD